MPSARNALRRLERRGLTLAVAESFTGGALQDRLTDVPGASRAFLGGVVAYDNRIKTRLIRVPADTVRRHGAVSRQTALAMARGVRKRLGADVGVATTGIAGPSGATPEKPVGLSVVAVAIGRRGWTEVRIHRGHRRTVKSRAVDQALALLLRALARNG